MKKLVIVSALGIITFSSCEKNNCYTCTKSTTMNGALYLKTKEPKLCRITKEDLSNYQKANDTTYTGSDNMGNEVTYSTKVDCTEDKYW